MRAGLAMLENLMICINAALSGDFSDLETSVAVSGGEFVLLLNTIMLGLSQDIININLDLYNEFITFYIDGEMSEYQISQLQSAKSSIFSYCAMAAAEIVQQETEIAPEAEEYIGQLELSLEVQAQNFSAEVNMLEKILKLMDDITLGCSVKVALLQFCFMIKKI